MQRQRLNEKFYKSLKEHAVEIITKRTAEITSKGKNKSKISKITSKIKKYRKGSFSVCREI